MSALPRPSGGRRGSRRRTGRPSTRQVALGDDVGVALEHQRRARAATAVDDRHDVGPAGRDLHDLRLPAQGAHRSATSSAAGASPAAVAGSLTLRMRTSSWVKATTASSSTLRSTSVRWCSSRSVLPGEGGGGQVGGAHAGEGLGQRGHGRDQPLGVGVLGVVVDLARSAPVSTISPSCITATRSQTCRTTDRSCETNTRVRSSSSTRSVMRLSTWARTDTSRALTGSSATQDAGARRERPGDRDALALAAGELVRVAVGRLGGQPDRLEQLGDPRLHGAPAALGRPGVRRRCRGPACGGRASSSGPGTPSAAARRRKPQPPLGQPGDVGALDDDACRTWAGPARRGAAAAWTCRSRTPRRCRTARPARRRSSRPRRAWTTGPGAVSEVRGRW